MTVRPLLVPTRLYRGEGVDSYAARAARRNGTEARWIEKALEERRVITSMSKRHPARLQAWRDLGALHERAFATPEQVSDNWVTDRALCVQCCGGNRATGRAPASGSSA